MNNDIVPGKLRRAVRPEQARILPGEQPRPVFRPGVTNGLPEVEKLPPIEEPLPSPEKPRKRRLKWFILGVVLFFILIITLLCGFLLSPRDSAAKETIPVEIVSGMIPSQIAERLEEAGVIRNRLAFLVYARLSGAEDSLQAGRYKLSPADSVFEIILLLQNGPDVEEIEVTFKPGETLKENKKVLLALGYGEDEVDQAFSSNYDHPLFQGRPEGVDLEGYIFGETHRFVKGTSVKDILKRYFDDYFAVITENNLIDLYEKQKLSLYEGITLASIVQRESGGDDKAQIAQVFLLRLAIGMELGSDVTYQYIADKEGNPRDVNYDSPYNTRRYAGLPPGPIAAPGVAALKAVGTPASGDYLYFLSGDDNITYFARTLEEHQANIRGHCRQKCSIL